jgi:hypothetical protein
MPGPGSDRRDGRWYGAIGCLVVLFLPISLLGEWLDGRLTWGRAAALILGAALLLTVPLFLAGTRSD